MRRLFAVLIALAPALPALATEVTTRTLDNGLEVVVLEDHRAPVVVHQVWYKAGAADEPPGKSGIAHYLEHLLFKGTDDLEEGELSATVARHGGSDNAFTHWDYTGYWQRVAADRLELMMEMEADRMRDLQIDDVDIATEREVILEERSQRVDSNPYRLFGEQKMAALYMNHPYGIPVIGWRHEMEALDLDDAMAFYRTYYAPNNAILIVAGDVAPDEVFALAEEHYGPLAPTAGLGPRERPQEPPQLVERRMTFEDPRISEPYVSRDYLAPAREPGAQEEAAALVILSGILGGNDFTSVLPRKLVHEDQTALYAWSYYSATSYDATSFGIGIQPVPGVGLEQAEAALDDALAEFLEEGIDDEQFERVKFQLRAQRIYAEDSTRHLAERYGRGLTSGLTVEDVQAWPDVLQAVTQEDVMAAARAVLTRDRAVTGWGRAPAETEEEAAAMDASAPDAPVEEVTQ
ncbi:pitrilysin family protein [Psychromarinibacter sp. C21-152]|uniref:Pitrilysin family protein n=1 Tax=Psychromarinibacter sediminicola TaxID=3033385 RepID=A0AAE3NVN7_9RHOB|nr:pitrilysin family protein [Psychromarinibacter sediminicola]MDF0601815.1 pitrilysin family protein [Psychromarinibacter sediminicola]